MALDNVVRARIGQRLLAGRRGSSRRGQLRGRGRVVAAAIRHRRLSRRGGRIGPVRVRVHDEVDYHQVTQPKE